MQQAAKVTVNFVVLKSFFDQCESCKNFFKNDQPILSLYTKNIREYQIAISEKGHWWKTNFRLMCYLGGSKLSKKSTFKFVPIRNGIEGLAATCDDGGIYL